MNYLYSLNQILFNKVGDNYNRSRRHFIESISYYRLNKKYSIVYKNLFKDGKNKTNSR